MVASGIQIVLLLLFLTLLPGCQGSEEPAPPAGPAVLRSREVLAWPEPPPGVVVERWRLDHPAGALELLVARPAEEVRALGLLANRAVHGGADTLREFLPLAARGHLLAAADWYRAPLAAAGGGEEPAAESARRRRRALAWMAGALDLIRTELDLPWERCWLLGGSRGSTLVAALARQRPELHHLVRVAPVPLPGGGMEAAVDALLARGGRLLLVSGRRDPARGFQESLRERAAGAATWVDLDAAHVFPYGAALDAGLAAWLAAVAPGG